MMGKSYRNLGSRTINSAEEQEGSSAQAQRSYTLVLDASGNIVVQPLDWNKKGRDRAINPDAIDNGVSAFACKQESSLWSS